MKSLLSNKRSKAIFGIGLIAILIGAISKKVISYPTGGCMKGNQELTLNKGKTNYLFNQQAFYQRYPNSQVNAASVRLPF